MDVRGTTVRPDARKRATPLRRLSIPRFVFLRFSRPCPPPQDGIGYFRVRKRLGRNRRSFRNSRRSKQLSRTRLTNNDDNIKRSHARKSAAQFRSNAILFFFCRRYYYFFRF